MTSEQTTARRKNKQLIAYMESGIENGLLVREPEMPIAK